MKKYYNQAIWLAMVNEQGEELLENALEELKLLDALPPDPSKFVLQAGIDPLQEIRAIIAARIQLLQNERQMIIGKYE